MPPKIIMEMPLPMPYWVMSSPIQIRSIVPATIVITIASVPNGSMSKPKLLDKSLTAWRAGIDELRRTIRLGGRQRNCQPVGILIDPVSA